MKHVYHHRWNLAALSFVLSIYIVAFGILPAAVFWSPDEGAKFIQLKTINSDGGSSDRIPYRGERLDPSYQFYPQHHPDYPIYPKQLADGQARTHWPVLFPLLSTVPYKLLGMPGLYLIPLVSGLLIVVLSGWLAYRYIQVAAPVAMVVVGSASPIFFYSLLFWEHTLAVLIGLAALGLAGRLREAKGQKRWLGLLIIGALLASSVMLRLELVGFALALIVATSAALFLHHRHRLSFQAKTTARFPGLIILAASAFLGLIFAVVVLASTFSGLLSARHQELIRNSFSSVREPDWWINLPAYLQEIWISPPAEFGLQGPALLIGAGLAGIILSALAVFGPRRVRLWLLLLSGLLVGLVSIYFLFSPVRYRALHSLFLPAPYLIFTFLFLAYARRERRFEVSLLALTTLAYLIFGTMAAILRGSADSLNLEWGPRYLLMFYPLAGVCAAVGICHFYRDTMGRRRRSWLLALATMLLVVGIQYQVRGVQEIQITKQGLIAYAEILAATDQPVVTDIYWLPAALAPNFVEQEMYTLVRREDLNVWLDLSQGQVESFLFVGFDSPEPYLENSLSSRPPLALDRARTVHGLTFAEYKIVSSNESQAERAERVEQVEIK